MKIVRFAKILSLIILCHSGLFSQTDFWAHHSLDFRINSLQKSIEGNFYAASDTSILKSSNYGQTWEVIYTTPQPCNGWTKLILYLNINNPANDKLIVEQDGCLNTPAPIITLDGGNTWIEFTTPETMRDAAINSIGDIYVLSDTNLYLTTDDGNNWQTVNIPILEEDEYFRKLDIDTLNTLYISKSGVVFVPPYYLQYENIYRSTNYGQDWNFILTSGGGPGFGYSSMFTIPKGDLFASVEGKSETQHYFDGTVKEYSAHSVKSAHITSAGDIFLASIPWGIKVSYNNGITWIPENSGLTSLYTSSIISDSLGYLYTSTGDGIFKSNFTSYSLYRDSAIIMDDTKIADTSYSEITIYNPFTFELSIDSITTTLQEFFIPIQSIQTIPPQDSVDLQVAFSPSALELFEGDIIFYDGIVKAKIDIIGNSPRPFLISKESIAFGLINIGETKVDTLAITSESINTLALDTIYLSKNLVFDLKDLIYPQFLEHGDTLNILLRFTPDTAGIFRDTLNIISNAINGICKVRLVGIAQNTNRIYSDQNVITEFSLFQNYPNPFNPVTTISYQIPERGFVTLKLYDVLGNEVETLISEEKPAGSYEAEFDGSNLTSGIYFYRMKAGNFVESKKMILLK